MPESDGEPSQTSFHNRFIEAANNNQSVLEFRKATAWWSTCWSEEAITVRPPMRVEFEHAIVFSTFSEALSLRRSKSGWGTLLRIEPLRVDDALHPTRIVYQLKSSSTMRQRWEFRDTFKNILGKDRRLVSDAMRLRKRDFLAQLTEPSARIIRNQLDLRPEEFWRAVRQGERYGPHGIHRFMRRLEERAKGYRLDFEGSLSAPSPDIKTAELVRGNT